MYFGILCSDMYMTIEKEILVIVGNFIHALAQSIEPRPRSRFLLWFW